MWFVEIECHAIMNTHVIQKMLYQSPIPVTQKSYTVICVYLIK